jgi:hypothetical protein
MFSRKAFFSRQPNIKRVGYIGPNLESVTKRRRRRAR